MTVSAQTTKSVSYGNSVATSFDFDFKVASSQYVVLTLSENGVDTEVDKSLYSVALGANNVGGSVTYPLSGDPVGAGVKVTIHRRTLPVQEYKFGNQGNFFPQAHEDANDKAMMLVQEIDEVLSRCVKLGIGSDDNPDEIVASVFQAASDAAEHAGIATDKAVEAADSATEALGHAEDAQTYAGEAMGYRDQAAGMLAQFPGPYDVAVVGDKTLTATDSGKTFKVNSAGSASTITAPPSDESETGEVDQPFRFEVARSGGNSVSVVSPDATTIDGSTEPYVVADGTLVRFTLQEFDGNGDPLSPHNWSTQAYGAAVGDSEPLGAVKPFFRVTAPTGYIALNGVDFSAATYPDLTALVTEVMAALGYTNADAPYFYRHNDLTNPTTSRSPTGVYVKVPDWADRFFRNVGSGRLVGFVEEDAFQGHKHKDAYSSQLPIGAAYAGAWGSSGVSSTAYALQQSSASVGANQYVSEPVSDGTHGTPRSANETRPKNVALLWCIKAANMVQPPSDADIEALIAEMQATNALVADINSGNPDFESAETVLATAVSWTHGLGAYPSRCEVFLRCTTAERGYSVGDEIALGNDYAPSVGAVTISVSASSITFAATTTSFFVAAKGGGLSTSISPANWRLVARAWKGTTLTGTALTYADIAALLASYPKPLGVDQTWQDITASRAKATDYTNSTGRTIFVSATMTVPANTQFWATVGGVEVVRNSNALGAAQIMNIQFPVQPGVIYRIDTSATTITKWAELR